MNLEKVTGNSNFPVLICGFFFLVCSIISQAIGYFFCTLSYEANHVYVVLTIAGIFFILGIGAIYTFPKEKSPIADNYFIASIVVAIISMICVGAGYLHGRSYHSLAEGVFYYNADPYAPSTTFSGYNVYEFPDNVVADSDKAGFYTNILSSKHYNYYATPLLKESNNSGKSITFWAVSQFWYASCSSDCVAYNAYVSQKSLSGYVGAIHDAESKFGLTSSESPILVSVTDNVEENISKELLFYRLCFSLGILIPGILFVCVIFYFVKHFNNQDYSQLEEKSQTP